MQLVRNLLRRKWNLATIGISFVLVGFIGFLVLKNYHSRVELQQYALEEIRYDVEKRGTAVSYFYSERRNDLKDLAESRELSIFFENKALGMSMQYGLRASLLTISESFNRLLEQRKLGEDRIYTRIFFVDSNGELLVDTQPTNLKQKSKQGWKKFVSPIIWNMVIVDDSDGKLRKVMISFPYFFKFKYAGQIIAVISPETVYKHLIEVAEGSSKRVTLVGWGKNNLQFPENLHWKIPLPFPVDLNNIEIGKTHRFHMLCKNETKIEMLAIRGSVKGTPFSLIDVLPASEIFGPTAPWQMPLAMGMVSLAILSGMAIILHVNAGNLVLNARLDESSKRGREIEEKNIQLQKEITERERMEEALRRAHDELEIRVKERTAELLDLNEQLQLEIIERKHAEEGMKSLAQENAIIAEIGRIISSTLNIEEVSGRFAKEAQKLISFDAVAVNMVNHKESNISIPYVSEIGVPGCQHGEVLPLLGSVTGEVVNKRSGLIFQAEDRNEVISRYPTLLTAFDKGLRSLMVVPLISKDQVIGALHFRSLKSKAFSDQDMKRAEIIGNEIAGALANAQLFSDLKQAEEVLQTEKERFQTLSENAPFGMVMIDHDNTFKYLNPKFRELFGYDLKDIPDGKTWFSKAYPDPTYRQGVISTWVADLKNYEPGEKIHRTFTVASKDGTERVINFIPVLLETGEILMVCEDVTERKRMDDALLNAAQQWRTTFDSITDMVSLLDLEGGILRCNKAMANYIGKPFNEIIKHSWWEMVLGTKALIEDCPFLRSKKTLQRETITLPLNDRWFNISIDPILDETGSLIGAVNIISDITERKRAEKEMAALQEQFRQSQKMEAIGQLAGGVAHDFNNLLTVIRGYSQLSLGELPKGTPLWENIEEIRRAADRAADLTRQLLAFSRRQILEFKTVNLNNLIQAMEKMLRRMIGEDIELIIHGAENLGSIKTDPGQMEQILMNIVVNARDAMPSGGKLILETDNVHLDEEYARSYPSVKPGYYVKLSISDTGCGMTPEIRERVFEPFFTTKEKGKGTGLGLSTVYGIVKQSDGNVWVHSEPGKGTTFAIYLPRMDGPAEMLIKKGESDEVPRGDETVLVVEDEEAVRKYAVRILKKQGYKVLEATQGDEALLALERHPETIDLILTDVVMPGMSGPKLVESLQQIRKKSKILYMSGYTDESVIRHGVREGEVNFVQKPFTLEMLGRRVREVLDHHS